MATYQVSAKLRGLVTELNCTHVFRVAGGNGAGFPRFVKEVRADSVDPVAFRDQVQAALTRVGGGYVAEVQLKWDLERSSVYMTALVKPTPKMAEEPIEQGLEVLAGAA